VFDTPMPLLDACLLLATVEERAAIREALQAEPLRFGLDWNENAEEWKRCSAITSSAAAALGAVLGRLIADAQVHVTAIDMARAHERVTVASHFLSSTLAIKRRCKAHRQ
jgi:hypothetical protein